MAKRMTDSNKWTKPWYRNLSPPMKLLWGYILDNCDMAGVWSEDLDLASYLIKLPIDREEYETSLASRFVRLEDGKVFVPGFIDFQYGELSEESRPHLSVIKALKRYGIDPKTLRVCIGYPGGTETPKDKDKNKDKDQEKAKEGGVGGDSALPVSPKNATLGVEIEECVTEFRETLRFFKQGRTLLDVEKFAIGRAIQSHGVAAVKLALSGARYEPGSEKFKPADWVDLNRYLDPKNFKRFIGYGVKYARMVPEGAA